MKEIHIECAGAGKTYGIAKKIIELIASCPSGKRIYAITYTNYAVEQIKGEVKKQLHYVPNEVVVITVHSFLLEHIIYPYSAFVKGEKINSCTIEKLPSNIKWRTKRKRQLKDYGIIHSSSVSQYAKSIIVPTASDNKSKKKLKAISLEFLVSDVYCLFVDEAQDMDKDFFDLMHYAIGRLKNFYFVGDPLQALWGDDQYKSFTETIEVEHKIPPIINMVSRRVPKNVIPLCNRILSYKSQISTCSEIAGEIAYVLVSELLPEELEILSKGDIFSIIKCKNNIFSTTADKRCLTHEFKEILTAKYPMRDTDAMVSAVVERIEDVGLTACLNELNIRLESAEYAKLAQQFGSTNTEGILLRSIQKIKGLEDKTVYFVICNSLLEILAGIKNDYNKETKLLYVALTRTKSRLLFIVDNDETMKRNFNTQNLDIESVIQKCGVPKAEKEKWFIV